MITPSFSLTATERVLPKLALDFTTAALDSRVTFTRTTDATHPATYVNSSGYVTAATNDQPRFDYSPTALTCKGLLIEESRTNTLTYSADFSNAGGRPWQWIDTTTTQNATTSPDNTNSGNKIIETATSATHRIRWASFTASANGTYTFSVYLKPAERSVARLLITGVGGTARADFDVSNGTIANLVGDTIWSTPTATCTAAGNSWYRCTITSTTTTAGAGVNCDILVGSNQWTFNYLGDITKGIYGWGAQVETGAFATSYIPTTSASLTRNADVATMTGTNFSSWFNATEGTFDVEGTIVGGTAATYPYVVAAVGANVNTDSIGILWGANNSLMRTSIRAGGVTQTDISGGSAKTAGSTFKVASAYKANSFQSSFNGSLGTEDTSGSLPTVTYLSFCGPVAYQSSGNYIIKKFFYYPQRLINANVQSITYN